MFYRIKGQPAQHFCGGVAKAVGRITVGDFMQNDPHEHGDQENGNPLDIYVFKHDFMVITIKSLGQLAGVEGCIFMQAGV